MTNGRAGKLVSADGRWDEKVSGEELAYYL